MGSALTFAIGVALSPVPIAAMILILGGTSARPNGPLFAVGWIVGVAVTAGLFVGLVQASGISDDQPSWLAAAELLFGAAFVVLAVRLLILPRRSTGAAPWWLSAVDAYGPVRATGLGMVLAGANPKNLALALGSALALARADFSGVDALPALVAYTAIAAVGVLIPLAAYTMFPKGSRTSLDWTRRFVVLHDRPLLVVLALAIGAKFLLDGAQAL